ncbi:TetR/AcrR family transcriptional regulator [Roseovarius nanhaiticus]|uniref:Transcriptional regulator, TetR family n=1 Tax=Roseovarius nanhaiticus TaxID=573024 RepID=A0A1N7H195_9RHOB|nr:TetR family transcriptional regulator C-terminal domain-containing protein [Roseovarius nanhaiticus]SEL16967.1 transcriptional regulator, TetR family [Roseovarius nanhaiticus]SIS18448.1 transcriptional regulator, TetR family [Roseovarius nanhaiticus]
MSPDRKPFRRIGPDQRREAMIDAMLAIIAEEGITAATTRAVAARAGVTPGLIRHYFDSKDALLSAAYERHMDDLTRATSEAGQGPGQGGSAAARLTAFIEAGLRAPIVSTQAVSLWAGFLTHVQQSAEMHAVHARTYAAFRDHLQMLVADALREAGRPAPTPVLRRHAIACNAVIDGLWLEGGMLPGAFGPDELASIGREAIGAMLDLPLNDAAQVTRTEEVTS